MLAKTMARIVAVAILLILLAAGAVVGLYMCASDTPLENARTQALNGLIDGSGIKGKIDASLRERASEIAQQYGIPETFLDAAINDLAIEDWKVTNAPKDAVEDQTLDLDVQDSQVHITTYKDDPSIVTVESSGKIDTFGQDITFAVPSSAQGFTGLLPYFGVAQDAGVTDAVGALVESQQS